MVGLTSAAGVVGFLSEPDAALQSFALRRLNDEIDVFWPEMAGSINTIESLYEDEAFPDRQLAALVTAKVYYQLQEYNESMVYALGAGKLFDIHHAGEFEETILAKCLDTYIALSAMHNPPVPASTANQPPPQLSTSFLGNANGGASTSASMTSPITPFSQSALPSKSLLSRQNSLTFDPSLPGGGNAGVPGAHPSPLALSRAVQKDLQATIRRLFDSCFEVGAYKQVVGIAIEARNLDVLRESFLRASHEERRQSRKSASEPRVSSEELMEYVLDMCMNVVQERGLRNEILRLILDLLSDLSNTDYFAIAKCVVYLGQHSMASNLLRQLIERGEDRSRAIAYQVSFHLYENSTQEFLGKVMQELPGGSDEAQDSIEEKMPSANGDASHQPRASLATERDPLLSNVDSTNEAPATSTVVSRTKPKVHSAKETKTFMSVRQILRGSMSIELNLEFLYRNNRADKHVLNKIRDSVEGRNSIFHTAVTFANAFMNSGTTNDKFFRDNLDWLGKATNWSKFTATASLGVIHRGNITQGQKLLQPYLPNDDNMSASVYERGGSLYALGMIYCNHGTHVLDFLVHRFKVATEEVIQHGGALGVGVAGMATGSEDTFDALRMVLFSDSAINGEAVGLAMGLVMLGTGNIRALEDMIQYARDTQHDKIVRGLAMGMALIMYARQEAADELINGLLDDPNPTLRYGGILAIALAYCGSGSNKAVRRLLHVAVSDVNDDVRRMAVMSLGFILFRKPGSVPRMVELLAESYNPHVRYGATMALGIACAGTGLEDAVDLLEPMMKDSVDFVRQGALISLAMILVQQNELMNPKVGSIRKTLERVIGERHEDAVTKFGCSLALGIIDAGGRNCTINLQTQAGTLNMTAIVGMAIFTQYWYWYPFTHFLSLSFTPTAIIGVTQDLEVPAVDFHSNTRPSMFDYPPEHVVKTEEAPEMVKAAVLSTTAQDKRRKMEKAKQRRESMDVDQTPTAPNTVPADDDKMDVDEDPSKAREGTADGEKGDEQKEAEEPLKKRSEKEKPGYDLGNMSRVLPAQAKYISFASERYEPVKRVAGAGVVVLVDTQPSEPQTLLERRVKKVAPVWRPGEAEQSLLDNVSSDPASAASNTVTGAMAVDEATEDAEPPDAFDYESEADNSDDDEEL